MSTATSALNGWQTKSFLTDSTTDTPLKTSQFKMPKPTREELERREAFSQLRQKLSETEFDEQLDRPIAFWTLPSDRGLPFALLDRSIKQILETPYDNLAATPGIGTKKLDTLLMLLARIIQSTDEPPVEEFVSEIDEPKSFDPMEVSEQEWGNWCALIDRFNIGSEMLGRVAPNLRDLPSVLWHKPLSTYMTMSLSEIRNIKSFGAKRVAAVITVFHSVRGILAAFESQDLHPSKMLPRNIMRVELWIDGLSKNELPSQDKLKQNLANPLLDQIQIDATPNHLKLLRSRFGIDEPKQSIRQQARQMGMARARIYQLLEDCTNIFNIRWLEASETLEKLASMFSEVEADDERVVLISAIKDIAATS